MNFIAQFLGISVLRLALYAGLSVAVVGCGIAIRQHYVNLGWNKAITAVKKQDDRAVDAAERVQQKANDCAAQSYWDVISQSCRTEDAK